MLISLIEFFGAAELRKAFWLIGAMTAPIWLLMLLWGRNMWVRRLAHPFVIPPLYCGVLFYILWKSYEISLFPDSIESMDYSGAKEFARHPVAFLALFCNWQILNLMVGTMIFQKGYRSSMCVTFELLLCWIVGAPAALIFTARLVIQRKSFGS